MAPRRYDRSRRDEAMAAVRARIVDAVVELHAELGPSRTTYAMIARRADVAIPTVYKHFPTLAGLFSACIGHVSARVPALTSDVFAGCDTVAGRLEALTRELFERHRLFAPWLRWSRHEAHLLPDMAVFFTKMRERHVRLIREALHPAFGSQIPDRIMASVEILTGFDAWRTFTVENRLSSADAVKTVSDILERLTVAGRAKSDARRRRAGRPDAA